MKVLRLKLKLKIKGVIRLAPAGFVFSDESIYIILTDLSTDRIKKYNK